ncbi:MAG: hypothetical protein ACO30M_10290, partial [Candidatus Kapaibacteriota bacterium]
MECSKAWSISEYIQPNFGTAYAKSLYKKEQDIIWSQQMQRMEETQDNIQAQRRNKEFISTEFVNRHLQKLMLSNNTTEEHRNLLRDIAETFQNKFDTVENQLYPHKEKEKKEQSFIIHCPKNDCKGLLNKQHICGICETKVCKKCTIEITGDDHECKEDDVKNTEFMKKDCKPCPGCGASIHKINGCNQMFCTLCRTVFDWKSLSILKNTSIHNPHYFEYLRNQSPNGEIPRDAGQVCNEVNRLNFHVQETILNRYRTYYKIG